LQKIIFTMNWSSLSNNAIIEEVGKRLKKYRFQRKFTQKELADQAGISVFSVTQIERGKAVTLPVFLSVLRVLRLLDNFELLIPEIGISPIELLKLKGKTPKRIKKSKKETEEWKR
jgi:transcriptional regulator with XRE-family HTH domain